MDQSISRSVLDNVGTGTRSLLIQGKYSKIDILFPLFDQMAQLTKIPSVISPIFGFYYGLQAIFSCFWANTLYWDNSSDNSIISTLTQIFWFIDTPPSKINFVIVFIILLIITVFLNIYICGVFWFYKRNLRFRTWSLYISRYAIECFIPILLYPSAALFGSSLYLLIYQENRIYWVYTVFSFLILAFMTAVFLVGHATFSHSCCISITIFSSFDIFFSFTFYVINMLPIILSYIFHQFPSYGVNVFQGVRIVLFVFLCFYFLKNFPFHHKVTNIFHLSILIIELLGDLISFILFLSKKHKALILLISILVLIIIVPIAVSFIVKYFYDKIVNDLSPNNDVELLSDNNYKDYFEGLGLNNKDKSILYLHVGFTQMAPLFINWSLPKYMYLRKPSKKIASSVIQIISFFPSETVFLNQIFTFLSSKPELTFFYRFLVYQIYRIKSLRQSTSSSDVNDRLTKLRSQSSQCLINTLTFWNAHESTIAIFESLSQEQRRINSLWIEAIRDFPNSPKLYDECATFLIECMCEFQVAISMKKKCELIETGSSFAVDAAFRSMVWSYPGYIKKGILDCKGNVLEKATPRNQSTELILYSTETLDLDSSMDFDENLGKQILNKSRLRLAFDSALKTKTHTSFSVLPIISSITLFIGLIIFFFLCFYIKDAFSIRKDCVKYINYLGMCHFHTRLASFSIITRFVENYDRFKDITAANAALRTDGISPDYIAFDENNEITSLREAMIGRQYFSDMIDLLDTLVAKSNMGTHEVELMTPMIDRSVNFYQCENHSINEPMNMTFHSVLSYVYFIFSYLISRESTIDYYNNDLFCEAVQNQVSLFAKIDQIYIGFITYADEKNSQLQQMNKIFSIVFPLFLFILSFIPYLICALVYVKHVNKISTIILSFDKNIKSEIMQRIRKDVDIELNTINEPHVGIPLITPITVLLFLFALLTTLVCFGMTKFSNNNCKYINKLNIWTYHAVIRLISSVDLLIQVYHTIALNQTNMSYFFTRKQAVTLVNQSFRSLTTANTNLLRGDTNSNTPPLFEVDSILDDLNYNEDCEVLEPVTGFHDAYKCSSCDKLVASLNDLLQPIILYPDDEFNSFTITQMLHILNSHFWFRCVQTIERLTELADSSNDETTNMMYVFLALGIISSFFVFIGGFILKSTMSNSYRSLLGAIKRIPPHLMVANKDLKNFLLNKDEEKDTITSDSRSVLHNSSDAMMCINLSGVVEMVNPAVTSTLGFTPEQILGQPIMSFFSQEDADKIIDEMNIIIEGQNGTVYEDHMQCITDNSTLLPVATTLLGMQLEDGVSTQSFVLILRNESELIKTQQDAEEAKAKSENLLLHILPEKVIMMINQGERDICFTVPNCTICYLDVVKFSEYSKSLQPHQILGSLSCLFSSFDNLLYSYPLIIKIKLIGDIYMAAAGLFTEGDKIIEHANQTVRFGLEALMTLDDVNVKLDANLQVRCGINTGGPIIAGVLGTDKPMFDIIGDTINVAARLQTTDIPGQIQTTSNTVDLLDRSEFNIHPRGEVFLKGKGKVMTYLITNDIQQQLQQQQTVPENA